MKNYSFFRNLDGKVMFNEFIGRLKPKTFNKNEVLMKNGDVADWMCVMIEGTAIKKLKGMIVEEIDAPAILNEEAMHADKNDTIIFDYDIIVTSQCSKCLTLNQR